MPTEEDKRALISAALSLSGTQLQLQIADEASLDGRTMGLLAFDGALGAVAVATKDVLHGDWWTILPAVVVSAALCLRSALGRTGDFGPEALRFYTKFGAGEAIKTQEALLADLDLAFKHNAKRVKLKIWLLRIALGSLAVGLVVATVLIASDWPSRMKTCSPSQLLNPRSNPPRCQHRSPRGSHTSGQAALSQKAKGGGELVEVAEGIEGGRHGSLVELAREIEAGK
jgi:hypothetical protein